VFDLVSPQSFEKCKRIVSKVVDLPGVVVAIVGNKADLADGEEIGGSQNGQVMVVEEYARTMKVPYFKVSAKTGSGVDRMFQEVIGVQKGATESRKGSKLGQGGHPQNGQARGHKNERRPPAAGDGHQFFKDMLSQKKHRGLRDSPGGAHTSANKVLGRSKPAGMLQPLVQVPPNGLIEADSRELDPLLDSSYGEIKAENSL